MKVISVRSVRKHHCEQLVKHPLKYFQLFWGSLTVITVAVVINGLKFRTLDTIDFMVRNEADALNFHALNDAVSRITSLDSVTCFM